MAQAACGDAEGGMIVKNNTGCLICLVVSIVAIVLSVVLTKAIVNSDLPLWLKIMLLR